MIITSKIGTSSILTILKNYFTSKSQIFSSSTPRTSLRHLPYQSISWCNLPTAISTRKLIASGTMYNMQGTRENATIRPPWGGWIWGDRSKHVLVALDHHCHWWNQRELSGAAPNPAWCRHQVNAIWCHLDSYPGAHPPIDPTHHHHPCWLFYVLAAQ